MELPRHSSKISNHTFLYNHKNWGRLGISLATAMAISVVLLIVNCNVISAPIGSLGSHGPARRAARRAAAIIVILLLGYWPVLAGIIYDWRTRGRPHPVYLVGLLSLATGLLVPVISRSDAWLATIDHLVNLMG